MFHKKYTKYFVGFLAVSIGVSSETDLSVIPWRSPPSNHFLVFLAITPFLNFAEIPSSIPVFQKFIRVTEKKIIS